MRNFVNSIGHWPKIDSVQDGDSYAIPENVEHSFEILEAGEVIAVFTPIRQDYL